MPKDTADVAGSPGGGIIPSPSLPGVRMLWVTGQAPHVDAAASAWLLSPFRGSRRDVRLCPGPRRGPRAGRHALRHAGRGARPPRRPLHLREHPPQVRARRPGARGDGRTGARRRARRRPVRHGRGPGLDAVINGLRTTHPDPAAFLAAAEPVIEGLYSWFTRLEESDRYPPGGCPSARSLPGRGTASRAGESPGRTARSRAAARARAGGGRIPREDRRVCA